jgi:hypothetical protein
MRKKHKIFTSDRDIARLRELWSAGIALEAIAKEFSCSPTTVALACGRLGMHLRQAALRPRGSTEEVRDA